MTLEYVVYGFTLIQSYLLLILLKSKLFDKIQFKMVIYDILMDTFRCCVISTIFLFKGHVSNNAWSSVIITHPCNSGLTYIRTVV